MSNPLGRGKPPVTADNLTDAQRVNQSNSRLSENVPKRVNEIEWFLNAQNELTLGWCPKPYAPEPRLSLDEIENLNAAMRLFGLESRLDRYGNIVKPERFRNAA